MFSILLEEIEKLKTFQKNLGIIFLAESTPIKSATFPYPAAQPKANINTD